MKKRISTAILAGLTLSLLFTSSLPSVYAEIDETNALSEPLMNSANLFNPINQNDGSTNYAMSADSQSAYSNLAKMNQVREISNILQANFDAFESDTIIMNFFGEPIMVSKEKVTIRDKNDYTWYGTVQNQDSSSVILVVKNDKITGTINTIQKQYSIVPLGKNLHVVLDVDSAKYPEEHPPEYSVMESESAAKFAELALSDREYATSSTDNPQVITALVAYTPAARDSTIDINSLIQLAVDETNQGYENSDIPITLELVHTHQVDYIEANFFTDLDRLMAVNDGYMDEVHDLRDIHAADVVILIVDNRQYCGLATTILAEENEAFGVVHWGCATGYYTFAHEIGHLQGARHIIENDPSNKPFEYGHGFCDPNSPYEWRTIMAYNCPISTGGPRIQYWSNPDVTFAGDALGTEKLQDNARVLSETANDIASFRVETDTEKCKYLNQLNTIGNFADALYCYKQITIKYPGQSAYAEVGMAVALTGLQDFEQALDVIDNTISENPNYANALNAKGMTLYKKGDFDDAKEVYRQVISKHPQNAYAHIGLGDTYRLDGDIGKATLHYWLADKSSDDGYDFQKSINADAKNGFGLMHQTIFDTYKENTPIEKLLGELDTAIFFHIDAVKVNEKSVDGYNGVGNVLVKRGVAVIDRNLCNLAEIVFDASLHIHSENRDALEGKELADKCQKEVGYFDQKSTDNNNSQKIIQAVKEILPQ